MTDLASSRARLRQLLGDPAAARYGDELLDEALRWALSAYSRVLPQVQTAVLEATIPGREQSLAGLAGLAAVLEVSFPYRAEAEPPVGCQRWRQYYRGGEPFLFIEDGRAPVSGDAIQVTYAGEQTLAGLDGAVGTTVPAMHHNLLTGGAAGKAALIRSGQLIEAHGSRASEPARLQAWGEAAVSHYLAELRLLKLTQALPQQPGPRWALDRWDAGSPAAG